MGVAVVVGAVVVEVVVVKNAVVGAVVVEVVVVKNWPQYSIVAMSLHGRHASQPAPAAHHGLHH